MVDRKSLRDRGKNYFMYYQWASIEIDRDYHQLWGKTSALLRTQETVVADLLVSVSFIIINLTLLKILTSNLMQC